MNWSTEQQAIFIWFKTNDVSGVPYRNLVVEALAGTGKTTTMKEGFRHAPERRMLYGVFNKKNQREAQEKIHDPRVEIRTWHSLGFMFIKKVWPNAKPNDEVEQERVENVLLPDGLARNRELVALIVRLVGFVKNTFITPTQDDIYAIGVEREIISESGSTLENEKIVTACARVLELSKIQDKENRISFNDMVWLPCAMEIVKPTFDLVVGDEAQDLNMPQLEMMKRCCKSTGRICVVGDSRQAIYSFRGAVQNAMQKMRQELGAAVLTLSVTYRCPQRVVELAKEIVPNFTAATEAPSGEIIHGQNAENIARVGDAILSRLNAPLMPLALSFLRRNIPARIEGRDIGKQLLARVRSFKAVSVPNFIERVGTWEAKEIARLEKTKNPEKKMEQTRDIGETLRALAMDAKNISDIDARINYLFQDTNEQSKPCVLLSSVHKAKGLEWNRVLLLTQTFRNGKGAQEEDNIWYVALTRAKTTLIFISDSGSLRVAPAPAVQVEELPTATAAPKCPPYLKNGSIPQSELDRIAHEADIALQCAEHIARNNDVYMARGVWPSGAISDRNKKQTESELDMSKKTTKKKEKSAARRKGDEVLFGYSPAAIARALGKMGASKNQAQAILEGKASPITISVQWDSGNGGFFRGVPAPITKEQFNTLMKGAPVANGNATKARKTTRKASSPLPPASSAKPADSGGHAAASSPLPPASSAKPADSGGHAAAGTPPPSMAE